MKMTMDELSGFLSVYIYAFGGEESSIATQHNIMQQFCKCNSSYLGECKSL